MFENLKPTGYGWDAYVKKDFGQDNPWIKFATDHEIVLSHQQIKHPKSKNGFKSVRRLASF